MQLYLMIVGFFALGITTNYCLPLSEQLKKAITFRANQWIIYVALTSIIFLNVPTLEFTLNALLPTLVAWSWLTLSAGLVLWCSKKLNLKRDIVGAMLLLVPLGNTSFIGYPMVSAFFDQTVLGYAIFYDQLGSFLGLSTYATLVLAIYAQPASSSKSIADTVSVKAIVFKVVRFPPLICLMVALFIPLDSLLLQFDSTLKILGVTLAPLALFTLGLQFNPVLVGEQVLPLSLSLGFKMFLAPLLVWLTVIQFDFPTEAIQASVFESAMPAMMTPGILAIQANLAPRFCATLLGYGTLLSMFSLPLIALLLK